MPTAMFIAARIAIAFVLFAGIGCANVRRTITVTSEPSGALVHLNGREVGRTPVEADFLYYGVYDVQLEREGFEPLITTGKADPPWWDSIPVDLASELTPGRKHAQIEWHYVMQPTQSDPAELIERAREMRARVVEANAGVASQTQPAEEGLNSMRPLDR